MSHQVGNAFQVNAHFQQMRCEGVTQAVDAALLGNASALLAGVKDATQAIQADWVRTAKPRNTTSFCNKNSQYQPRSWWGNMPAEIVIVQKYSWARVIR
jgi:hypothetical protein